MISYSYPITDDKDVVVVVKIEGRVVGNIRKVEGGYQYFPKGRRQGGHILATVQAVKRTLETA